MGISTGEFTVGGSSFTPNALLEGTKYYYAGSTRVAMRKDTTAPLWLMGDHLGSTSQVANNDGSAYSNGNELYKPWREKRYPNGASGLPTTFRFTGQHQDSYINLYWYGSRWYDDSLGRFTQPDTIVPEASQGTQAWDHYSYVNNNPVNHTDPSGHCLEDACIGEIAVATVVVTEVVENAPEIESAIDEVAAEGLPYAESAASNAVPDAEAAASKVINAAEDAAPVVEGDVKEGFGALSRAVQYGIDTYNNLRSQVAGTGDVVHHIIEQRFAPALGQTAAQARNWLSVVVTPEEHQGFTNVWRDVIGYVNSNNPVNTASATVNDVWNAAQDIYKNYPDLLNAAKRTIFGP